MKSDHMDDAMEKANGGPVRVPDSTDADQHALDVGIIPLRNEHAHQCLACKGISQLQANCKVCDGHGVIVMRDEPGNVTKFVTIDGNVTYTLPTSLVREKVFTLTDTQMDLAQKHLSRIVTMLMHARGGRKQFRVPIKHHSGLDGEDEHSIVISWGRNAQEAAYNATHNAQRMQWAEVDGKIESIGASPHFTPEWFAKVMDLSIPS